MEQASGSYMTGIRAFSAHLPLTLLCPSTALRFFVYFQVNTGVPYFLYYHVEDTYDDGGSFCPV